MLKALIQTATHRYLKKYCSSYFTVNARPISHSASTEHGVVLDTSIIPLWNGPKSIFISVAPFKPYRTLEVVKAALGQRYEDKLDVAFSFWDTEKNRYLVLSVTYIIPNGLTFGSTLGPYPHNFGELESVWNNFMRDRIDVTGAIRAPDKRNHFHYIVGKYLYRWLNHSYLPRYKRWLADVRRHAKEMGIDQRTGYQECPSTYWRTLYDSGYPAHHAVHVGGNTSNWEHLLHQPERANHGDD